MDKSTAVEFFSHLLGGEHRLRFPIEKCGEGFSITHIGDLASFDIDLLTKAVFLAHDYCLRFSIMANNKVAFGINLIVHPRRREGSIMERHPTLEQAIQYYIDNVRKEVQL